MSGNECEEQTQLKSENINLKMENEKGDSHTALSLSGKSFVFSSPFYFSSIPFFICVICFNFFYPLQPHQLSLVTSLLFFLCFHYSPTSPSLCLIHTSVSFYRSPNNFAYQFFSPMSIPHSLWIEQIERSTTLTSSSCPNEDRVYECRLELTLIVSF